MAKNQECDLRQICLIVGFITKTFIKIFPIYEILNVTYK